jgi:hypothetical protein
MHVEDCWMRQFVREEKMSKEKRELDMADQCIEAIQLFVQTDLIVDKGVGNFVKEFGLPYWAP